MQFARKFIWAIDAYKRLFNLLNVLKADAHSHSHSSRSNTVSTCKGSLTVEASLTLPVFITFFIILLYIIRLSFINITLDHAVNETAKQLAGVGYAVTFLNEFEDSAAADVSNTLPSTKEEIDNITSRIPESLSETLPNSLAALLSGNFGVDDVSNIIYDSVLDICNDYKKGVNGYLVNEYAGIYYACKTKAKYAAAEFLLEKHMNNSILDKRQLDVVMVELPQADIEYSMNMSNASYIDSCTELGIIPHRDDVIVAAEYKINITLPLLGTKTVTMRQTAVEKAWVFGSRGYYPENGENAPVDKENSAENKQNEDEPSWSRNSDTVFITRTGVKYHVNGCRYLSKSKIPIIRSDAVGDGYTACKVCGG